MIEFNQQRESEIQDWRLKPIKMVGLGHTGVQILDECVLDGALDHHFIGIDCDRQVVTASVLSQCYLMGSHINHGMGAGGDPVQALQIYRKVRAEILEMLDQAGAVILVAGMGGGTGGAWSVALSADLRARGIPVVVLAATPFLFEGERRLLQARKACHALLERADAAFFLSNDRLLKISEQEDSLHDGFRQMNRLIGRVARNLAAFLGGRNLMQINLSDLVHLSLCIPADGMIENCCVGYGSSDQPDRETSVLQQVINSPFFETDHPWREGTRVLVTVTAGAGTSLNQFQRVMGQVREMLPTDASLILGARVEEHSTNLLDLMVLVACGVDAGFSTGAEETQAIESQKSTFPHEGAAKDLVEAAGDDGKERSGQVAGGPEMKSPTRRRPKKPVVQQGHFFPTQEELAFDEKSLRGHFAKSDPTLVRDENIDTPTFVRWNIKLRQ